MFAHIRQTKAAANLNRQRSVSFKPRIEALEDRTVPSILAGPIQNDANGHQYYLLSSSTWTAAEDEAVKQLGGHLVTINDADENDWVFETFIPLTKVSRPELWIGLSDARNEGDYVWSSGETETASFRNWANGEPNNGAFGREDFVHMIDAPVGTVGQGKWNDRIDVSAEGTLVYFGVVEVVADTDIDMQSAQLQSANTVQFTYQTTGDPGKFQVGVYRSADQTFDASDVQIGGRPITPPASGGPHTDTANIVGLLVPDPTRPYWVVVADPPSAGKPKGDIIESNDTDVPNNNNVVWFALSDIKAVSTTTKDSQSVTIDYEITSAGLRNPLELQVFRSKVEHYDANQVVPALGVIALDQNSLDLNGIPIGAIGSHKVRVTVPLPLDLTPAYPYVVIVLDPLDNVVEIREDNNESQFKKLVLGVVTHGLIRSGNMPGWVSQMKTGLENRGYKRAIFVDWAAESNDRTEGRAIDAGLTMANRIFNTAGLMRTDPTDIIDIHLIGHSRGSVVVSQAAETLSLYPATIRQGYVQMTLLDPHPARNLGSVGLGMAELMNPINTAGVSNVGQFSVNPDTGFRPLAVVVLRAQAKMLDPPVSIPSYVDKSESFYQRTLASNVSGRFGDPEERILNLWGWVTPVAQPHDLTSLVPGISHNGVIFWYMEAIGIPV